MHGIYSLMRVNHLYFPFKDSAALPSSTVRVSSLPPLWAPGFSGLPLATGSSGYSNQTATSAHV